MKPAPGPAFGFAAPRALFNTGYTFGSDHVGGSFRYAISTDGSRFLLPRPSSVSDQFGSSSPITVVLNWTAALQK